MISTVDEKTVGPQRIVNLLQRAIDKEHIFQHLVAEVAGVELQLKPAAQCLDQAVEIEKVVRARPDSENVRSKMLTGKVIRFIICCLYRELKNSKIRYKYVEVKPA